MRIAVGADLAAQPLGAKAAGHLHRRVAIGYDTAWCELGTIALYSMRITVVPVQFHQPPEHALAERGHVGFHCIAGASNLLTPPRERSDYHWTRIGR